MTEEYFIASSEKRAIKKAIKTLKLSPGQFDVEIVSRDIPLLFGRKGVKIAIYEVKKSKDEKRSSRPKKNNTTDKGRRLQTKNLPEDQNLVNNIINFLEEAIQLMHCEAKISFQSQNNSTIYLDIESKDSALLIGRKGKNIDALHNLVNAYVSNLVDRNPPRVMMDLENYRDKKNSSLRRLALDSYKEVQESKTFVLLPAMLPEERKIIHTTLSQKSYITTESEGHGLYKKVCVRYKKNSNKSN